MPSPMCCASSLQNAASSACPKPCEHPLISL